MDKLKEHSGSIGVKAMPKECRKQMAVLGENIRLARVRRKIRQEDIGLSRDFSSLADPANDRVGLSMERMRMPERVRLEKDKELDF